MLLAIDTCGAVGGVALGGVGGDAAAAMHFRELAGKTFSERLIGAISEILAESEASLSQLAAVIVAHGPGSFTGIRIGVGAAKALAEALEIPLIAVSRLELLARKAKAPAVIATLDAGRGELFAGVYRRLDERWPALDMEGLLARGQAVALAANLNLPIIACEEQLASALEVSPCRLVAAPTAVDALIAGAERWRRRAFDDVAALDANYLRRSETEMLARIAEHAAIRAAEASVRE